MSLFQGRGLSCMRGGRTVFANLDFAVSDGAVLVLRGPNGSGKSSLLRLMAGLLGPAAGELSWDGEELVRDPEAHGARTHYVGHLDAVKPALTVAENLSIWAGLRTGDETGVDAALARFGLDRLAGIPARLLSAGQRRRLALARMVATPAPLWLLDEPTVALDAGAVAAVESAIAGHCGSGGIAVVSTHVDLGLERTATLELGDFAVDADDAWGPAWDLTW
jgi:heme exporter protein A